MAGGREGDVAWQSDDNLDKSISVLKTISEKYGAEEYSDVVYAIELVNEPISWNQNNFDTTKSWAKKAYKTVKAAATNKGLIVVMHGRSQLWMSLTCGLLTSSNRWFYGTFELA